MANIHIITGSVMGTALGVARSAQMILEGSGHTVFLYENFKAEDFTSETFNENSVLLICTSSTGMGDLPENITPFYQLLLSKTHTFTGIRYGVISLGDSSYPNFAEAGKLLDETLMDAGAKRLGEVFIMDAILVDDHEEEASPWINQWAALI